MTVLRCKSCGGVEKPPSDDGHEPIELSKETKTGTIRCLRCWHSTMAGSHAQQMSDMRFDRELAAKIEKHEAEKAAEGVSDG